MVQGGIPLNSDDGWSWDELIGEQILTVDDANRWTKIRYFWGVIQ